MADSVSMLSETIMQQKVLNKVGLFQLSADKIAIERMKEVCTPDHLHSQPAFVLQTSIPIKYIDMYGENLAAFSGKSVEIFEVKDCTHITLLF